MTHPTDDHDDWRPIDPDKPFGPRHEDDEDFPSRSHGETPKPSQHGSPEDFPDSPLAVFPRDRSMIDGVSFASPDDLSMGTHSIAHAIADDVDFATTTAKVRSMRPYYGYSRGWQIGNPGVAFGPDGMTIMPIAWLGQWFFTATAAYALLAAGAVYLAYTFGISTSALTICNAVLAIAYVLGALYRIIDNLIGLSEPIEEDDPALNEPWKREEVSEIVHNLTRIRLVTPMSISFVVAAICGWLLWRSSMQAPPPEILFGVCVFGVLSIVDSTVRRFVDLSPSED